MIDDLLSPTAVGAEKDLRVHMKSVFSEEDDSAWKSYRAEALRASLKQQRRNKELLRKASNVDGAKKLKKEL